MRTFHSFRLDTAGQYRWHGKTRADLAPEAFDLLRYLVEHAGGLVTPDELLEALWPNTYVSRRAKKVHPGNPEGAGAPAGQARVH
jgi:DNA-binding winged helix-turn-helix (wHTH) protein